MEVGRTEVHFACAAAITMDAAAQSGFIEAELVAHSGPTAKDSFVQTLTVTNIATRWTKCAPVPTALPLCWRASSPGRKTTRSVGERAAAWRAVGG